MGENRGRTKALKTRSFGIEGEKHQGDVKMDRNDGNDKQTTETPMDVTISGQYTLTGRLPVREDSIMPTTRWKQGISSSTEYEGIEVDKEKTWE